IGPEVVNAALRIIDAAGVPLEPEICEGGAKAFQRGIESGVPRETIDSVERTRVVLKGPLETPIGYGNKSANVTLRKLFETFANVRPVRELPGVETPYSGRNLDIVVVRENVEDLYAGIEHMETPGVAQCLKLISRPGSEKIARFAFEYAVSEGRGKIHCATKSNIMKLTEGMFQHTFEDVAKEYPTVDARHILVDNCAHQLAMRPEQFDIILTTNMNGDILSDLTSGLTGGLGFAPSANIGSDVAMFEAVHGSAPDIAGRNLANPTALILSAVMMLRHIGEGAAATEIEQSILVTLEQGVRTGDMRGDRAPASTTEFTDAIIANLGKRSRLSQPREFHPIRVPAATSEVGHVRVASRGVVGVDVFVESLEQADELGESLSRLCDGAQLALKVISNRGTAVWPSTGQRTSLVDAFQCRFVASGPVEAEVSDAQILDLLQRVSTRYRWVHVEKLQRFDGKDGFSKAQGEQ
ncbi:MAG TPA: NADP-dependent isocitrate dehydrogenase, partial [Candidatus Elarobacter sp.]|nr:NADP-dependent isocitrate dehydrogenase [Candidatus Elarobacter sp.]